MFGGKSESERCEKKNRLAILIDYENISREASLQGKVLDLDKVLEECLEIGIIDFCFVFVPAHLVSYRLPEYIYNKGAYIVSCPSAYNMNTQLKEKDRVDTIMSEIGLKLTERSDLTHIVIVSHDGDFLRLANNAKHHGKKVIVIAGENISFALKKVVEVHPLPLKNKNGNGY